MKHRISEMKNILAGINSRLGTAEEDQLNWKYSNGNHLKWNIEKKKTGKKGEYEWYMVQYHVV